MNKSSVEEESVSVSLILSKCLETVSLAIKLVLYLLVISYCITNNSKKAQQIIKRNNKQSKQSEYMAHNVYKNRYLSTEW